MRRIALLVIVGTLVTSCGSDDASSTSVAATIATEASGATVSDFATISAQDAASVVDSPPADLVVLDVRTPEEYAEGHLDGAVLVDFYDADFADQLSQLDPDVPYLVYCRSGNRSGQTLTMMQQLGFASAVDVDGGIVAWQSAGLPVVVE
ncbi:MAG TPA: rhodanese-like domain-containing protein [Ilumatobacteraceae bacterium]|nr:rhodanese-like domain-containing protein [Ilumatobacteraceae bacterium]